MQGRPARLAAAVVAIVGALFAATGTTVAAASVNLDQWASKANAWQNGNLNGNNAAYPEGGIVPFRMAMEGLAAGDHSIHINYDFTAGGHKAYDFLATWNVTNANGHICHGSGGAISSMCPSLPASSSAAFPSDGAAVDGLTVHGAEVYSAAPRRLTIWGGTIQSISAPVHSGSTAGNSSADILVRFRSTGSAVLLAWGGHLAQSAYWNRSIGGVSDGAGQVSGAPWHMRTLQLDGTGNKNQDRSIQPSAIVGELPPFALAPPTPTPRPPAPAGPAVTPRPGGGATSPPGPLSPAGPPGGPPVTLPPTETLVIVTGTSRAAEAAAGAVACIAVGLLALLPSIRRRARR